MSELKKENEAVELDDAEIENVAGGWPDASYYTGSADDAFCAGCRRKVRPWELNDGYCRICYPRHDAESRGRR